MSEKEGERPTDVELAICSGVLEWLADHMEKTEPHATSSIGVLRAAMLELPAEMNELE